jgi:transposase
MMANTEQIEIIKRIPVHELKEKIKDYTLQSKILKRLLFINFRYSGLLVSESSEKLGISIGTGYNWQERWNQKGYAGLIPQYAGGRPSKLSDLEKEELKQKLSLRDHWSTTEVKQLIQLKFGISYSSDQVRRILRTFGMYFNKPYPQDYRRPSNAEECSKNLPRMNRSTIIGLLDECSPQTTANTQRLWSFERKPIIKKIEN